MKKPSLALIPSGYKAGTVYSILPNNGDGDFTFTRNSAATRVNKDGLIEDVNADVPRLDYLDGGCPSLLLEPQRTNNILYSESLSPSDWVKFNAGSATTPIVTDNYAISPSGEMNASRLQMSLGGGTTSSDRAFIRQAITSQTDYYFSVYLKSTNGTEQKLNWHYGGDDFLITVTDEWQRFELNRNSSATTFGGIGLRGNLVSAIGIDDSVDILVYGFQVEQGSYATSYIPTNGIDATRITDICRDGGNANVFNDDEGVIYVEGKFPNTDETANRYISLSDGTASNGLFLYFFSPTVILFYKGIVTGVNQAFEVDNVNIQNSLFKVAFQYKLGENKLFFNGVEYTELGGFTDTVLSGLSDLSFIYPTNSAEFNANIKVKDLRYFDETLTDAELTELTTL